MRIVFELIKENNLEEAALRFAEIIHAPPQLATQTDGVYIKMFGDELDEIQRIFIKSRPNQVRWWHRTAELWHNLGFPYMAAYCVKKAWKLIEKGAHTNLNELRSLGQLASATINFNDSSEFTPPNLNLCNAEAEISKVRRLQTVFGRSQQEFSSGKFSEYLDSGDLWTAIIYVTSTPDGMKRMIDSNQLAELADSFYLKRNIHVAMEIYLLYLNRQELKNVIEHNPKLLCDVGLIFHSLNDPITACACFCLSKYNSDYSNGNAQSNQGHPVDAWKSLTLDYSQRLQWAIQHLTSEYGIFKLPKQGSELVNWIFNQGIGGSFVGGCLGSSILSNHLDAKRSSYLNMIANELSRIFPSSVIQRQLMMFVEQNGWVYQGWKKPDSSQFGNSIARKNLFEHSPLVLQSSLTKLRISGTSFNTDLNRSVSRKPRSTYPFQEVPIPKLNAPSSSSSSTSVRVGFSTKLKNDGGQIFLQSTSALLITGQPTRTGVVEAVIKKARASGWKVIVITDNLKPFISDKSPLFLSKNEREEYINGFASSLSKSIELREEAVSLLMGLLPNSVDPHRITCLRYLFDESCLNLICNNRKSAHEVAMNVVSQRGELDLGQPKDLRRASVLLDNISTAVEEIRCALQISVHKVNPDLNTDISIVDVEEKSSPVVALRTFFCVAWVLSTANQINRTLAHTQGAIDDDMNSEDFEITVRPRHSQSGKARKIEAEEATEDADKIKSGVEDDNWLQVIKNQFASKKLTKDFWISNKFLDSMVMTKVCVVLQGQPNSAWIHIAKWFKEKSLGEGHYLLTEANQLTQDFLKHDILKNYRSFLIMPTSSQELSSIGAATGLVFNDSDREFILAANHENVSPEFITPQALLVRYDSGLVEAEQLIVWPEDLELED